MPHAALWVVQLITAFVVVATACCFNAARGFVGGAALKNPEEDEDEEGFNAARGFVGGATSTYEDAKKFVESFQCRTRLCGWCSQVGNCRT